MAGRVARLCDHVMPQACAGSPTDNATARKPSPPDRAFAGFESPTGKTYAPGTSASLMGNMEPVVEEVVGELVLIHGSLPTSLDGLFIRNGPNPATSQDGNRTYHEFEGDGMLHVVNMQGGSATYANRYVQTARKALEQKKQRPLKQAEKFGGGNGYLGCANTALVYHAKRLMALYEVDKPYAMSLPHLETIGQLTYDDRLTHAMTAHPKVCPLTGELVFFSYELLAPKVHYAVADKTGKLLRSFEVQTKSGKPVMMHDMAITKNYSLLLEFPLYFEMAAAMQGRMPYVHDINSPSHFAVLPRHAAGADDIRWFTADTAMAFHILNAWEEGDCVRLIGCPTAHFSFDYKQSRPALLHEWVLNLKTGSTTERNLSDEFVEFPVANPRTIGSPTRYAWAVVFAGPGYPFHSICGCIKYDLQTGKKWRHNFVGERWGGESVFVPTGVDEDDGFLLTYTYNRNGQSTELYIVDAKTMDADPVAILRTPQRVPFGFHGLWVSRSEI
mmetsp:Transcript_5031/g.14267  ORF Transcript_5031/g.14267 Transcript_5031/m.14267 type:complete len:501 (-) Transcript_5031:80-1582(-)